MAKSEQQGELSEFQLWLNDKGLLELSNGFAAMGIDDASVLAFVSPEDFEAIASELGVSVDLGLKLKLKKAVHELKASGGGADQNVVVEKSGEESVILEEEPKLQLEEELKVEVLVTPEESGAMQQLQRQKRSLEHSISEIEQTVEQSRETLILEKEEHLTLLLQRRQEKMEQIEAEYERRVKECEELFELKEERIESNWRDRDALEKILKQVEKLTERLKVLLSAPLDAIDVEKRKIKVLQAVSQCLGVVQSVRNVGRLKFERTNSFSIILGFQLPIGVQEEYVLPGFVQENWRCIYDEPYGAITQASEVGSLANLDTCVLWGARRDIDPDNVLYLCAFGESKFVYQASEDRQTARGPHNGTFWYFLPGKNGTMGFAPQEKVDLNLIDRHDPNDNHRLSWYLGGLPGRRAGIFNVTDSSWRKVIWTGEGHLGMLLISE